MSLHRSPANPIPYKYTPGTNYTCKTELLASTGLQLVKHRRGDRHPFSYISTCLTVHQSVCQSGVAPWLTVYTSVFYSLVSLSLSLSVSLYFHCLSPSSLSLPSIVILMSYVRSNTTGWNGTVLEQHTIGVQNISYCLHRHVTQGG